MTSVVIVAYKTPEGQWRYNVRYGSQTRLFRKLDDANQWAAQQIAKARKHA